MLVDVVADEGDQLQPEQLLLLDVLRLEQLLVRLRALDDEFLEQAQVDDQPFLQLLDVDLFLRLDHQAVLVLQQEQELLY